jgi:hypothetical protein
MSGGDHYRPDSLKTVGKKSANCKLDSLAIQDVRWDRGDTEILNNYTLFM